MQLSKIINQIFMVSGNNPPPSGIDTPLDNAKICEAIINSVALFDFISLIVHDLK